MSSPLSFRTAREDFSVHVIDTTAEEAGEEQDALPPARRQAKELPFELREHCVIYFEESLYSQAVTLLTNLLVLGTNSVTKDGTPSPAFVAPPQHLALIATLTVHPSTTTRASSIERMKASNAALRLLRSIHSLVGPINAKLSQAFQFGSSDRGLRRSGRDRQRTDNHSPGNDETAADGINTEIATSGSLWSRAEDFWHAVGWAFNCSVIHPQRWERWRLWLEFMLDVLEEDWRMHEAEATASIIEVGDGADDVEEDVLLGTLISKYLQMDSRRHGGARRAVRAIFADGSPASLSQFKEVFPNETKKRKPDSESAVTKRHDEAINVEEDMYGDYLDSDDEASMDDNAEGGAVIDGMVPQGRRPRRTKGTSTSKTKPDSAVLQDSDDEVDGLELLGGMEAFGLRLRLLALLSAASARLPTGFTSLDSLYSIYSDHIRSLPLRAFSLIISPTLFTSFSTAARSSLTQLLLRSLISSSAPLPPPSVGDDISQDILETYYLPFAANTSNVLDNAKVSLLVEALFRLVAYHVGLDPTSELKGAVDAGIAAREAKAKPDGRRRGGDAGERDGVELARFWMESSAMRMKALVGSA